MTDEYIMPLPGMKDQVAHFESATEAFGYLIKTFGSIIVALVEACKSSPLLGMAVVLWVNGIIEKMKLIDPAYTHLVAATVIIAFGVSTTAEIEQLIPFLSAFTGKADSSFVRPTVTTDVTGGMGLEGLIALAPRLAGLLAG